MHILQPEREIVAIFIYPPPLPPWSCFTYTSIWDSPLPLSSSATIFPDPKPATNIFLPSLFPLFLVLPELSPFLLLLLLAVGMLASLLAYPSELDLLSTLFESRRTVVTSSNPMYLPSSLSSRSDSAIFLQRDSRQPRSSFPLLSK